MVSPPLPPTPIDHEARMRLALAEASAAELAGEVPVGALVFSPTGDILGRGHNSVLRTHDPTAHAELVALRAAALALGNYRLPGCTLVTTLEPCAMCAGAIIHARLATLIYAADDRKAGACGSALNVLHHPSLNHRVTLIRGVLASEASALLTDFFRHKRASTLPPS